MSAMSVVAPHVSRAGLFCFHGEQRFTCLGTAPEQGKGDTGGHISTEPRINDRIRVPEVRLVGPSGEQVGIVSITDALRLAQEADLDLVEVAPTARPPVCKLMDFGKFKYESALKARESRKNQAQTVIKEIKIRPKIDPHDYGTKKGHVERFLRQGDKVKVTIMFRGREQSRPELGYKLLQRLAGDVEELGFVESQPKQDGRNMIMVIGPLRKKADAKVVRGPDRASARAAAPVSAASQEAAAAVTATARTAAPARAASRPQAVGSPSASTAGNGTASSGTASSGTASSGTASSGTASSGTASSGTASNGAAGTQGTASPSTSAPAANAPAASSPARSTASGNSAPARSQPAASRPAASSLPGLSRPGLSRPGLASHRPDRARRGQVPLRAQRRPGQVPARQARPGRPASQCWASRQHRVIQHRVIQHGIVRSRVIRQRVIQHGAEARSRRRNAEAEPA